MWFRKKADFYLLLGNQAKSTEEGMQALLEFVSAPSDELGRRVMEMEASADGLRHTVIQELNLSFVTPIDREDIFGLSAAIDDVMDYGKSTVEEMMLFQVPTDPHLTTMVRALKEGSEHLSLAVQLLKTKSPACQEHLVRAKKTENFVEHEYRRALLELFKNPDVVYILKAREIYRHLSNAADRMDAAANVLANILVKNA